MASRKILWERGKPQEVLKAKHSLEFLNGLLGRIDHDVCLASETLDLGCFDPAPYAACQHEQRQHCSCHPAASEHDHPHLRRKVVGVGVEGRG